MSTILTIIASVLACIIGIWKYFGRKNAFRRDQAKKAKEDLDNAQKDKNKSDLLDAWTRINGMQ